MFEWTLYYKCHVCLWLQGHREQMEDDAISHMQDDIAKEVQARRKQLQVLALPFDYCPALEYGPTLVYCPALKYGPALVYCPASEYGPALGSGPALVYCSALEYGAALVYYSALEYGPALALSCRRVQSCP